MPSLKACRVLVTPTSHAEHDPALRSQLESEVGEAIRSTTGRPLTSLQLIRLTPVCEGYIAGPHTIDRPLIGAADGLKVIVPYGVGVDNVSLAVGRTSFSLACFKGNCPYVLQ